MACKYFISRPFHFSGCAELRKNVHIFLFACYMGPAYVDLQQFNTSHLIKDSDSSWYIRKPRQKTGQESIIPLLPAAIRILEKYSAKKNHKPDVR